MRFSYSRVSQFVKCPYKYKLRYLDHLKTIPDQNPTNPLYVGNAIHRGLETGSVEEAITDYRKHFTFPKQACSWEEVKLEYWIPKVEELLPPLEDSLCEVELKTKDFIGYIDRLVYTGERDGEDHYDLYDYKYSNSVDRYLECGQLEIYKAIFEEINPCATIDHCYYVFIPKTGIRLKKTETKEQFKDRLLETLNSMSVQVIESKGTLTSAEFRQCCEMLVNVKNFPRKPSGLCRFCEYEQYCQSNGAIDFNLKKKEEIDVDYKIPTPEEFKKTKPNKKVIMLYGAPYSGKTTLASKAPKPFFLQTDPNARYHGKPYVQIEDTKEFKKAGTKTLTSTVMGWDVLDGYVSALEVKNPNYNTVILDLVNDAYDMSRTCMFKRLNIKHESDDPGKAWDKCRTEFLNMMKRIVNLPYDNIILIFHEDKSKNFMGKNGEQFTNIKPKMPDRILDSVAGMCAMVVRCYKDGDKYMASVQGDDVRYGGYRLGIPGKPAPKDFEANWETIEKLFDDYNETLN